MRVHHLNCISSCPLGGRLMDGITPSVFRRGKLCCHCLLVESAAGLVLVDTGFGLRDVRDPKSRLSTFFLSLLSPDFQEEMTAVRQIERLGFRARDVRHIVLTHLDFDHAGGLDDFPEACVHMLRRERDAAARQHTWMDRQRFRPQQWGSRDRWVMHGAVDGTGAGDRWFGFEGVQGGHGLPDDVLLVPLHGHTLGHAGVALQGADRWLLQAGDAYFHHQEMDFDRPWCTPGLRMYQTMLEKDRGARLDNQRRLRELRHHQADAVEIFCAHDTTEYQRLAGRQAGDPVQAPATPAFA